MHHIILCCSYDEAGQAEADKVTRNTRVATDASAVSTTINAIATINTNDAINTILQRVDKSFRTPFVDAN